MKNLGHLMKQAQAMQSKMAELQGKMADAEIEGTSGAGMVTVTVNGKGEIKRLSIDPKLADPNEIEMLEDLIVAACADERGERKLGLKKKCMNC